MEPQDVEYLETLAEHLDAEQPGNSAKLREIVKKHRGPRPADGPLQPPPVGAGG